MRHDQRNDSQGFVLIACLLLLLLISGLAVGMLMRVRTETSVNANDLQNNVAFHAAEGAMEKMTSDLSNMFLNIQSPKVSDYTALNDLSPTIPNVTLTEYSISPATDSSGKIKTSFGPISSGPNQGLYAQLIPVTLSVTAQSGLANQVRMVRTAQVALIPVFQFGVFSQGDLAFFNSPNLDFNGRVHTNGDIYLGVSSGSTITFHDKITAYGNVIRKTLPNGLDGNTYSDTGTVNILTSANGCDGSKPSCKAISTTQGSVTSGPTSSQNSSWPTISKTTFNGWIVDGNYGGTNGTGATCLSLPFTTGQFNCPTGPGQPPNASGAQAFEIIRRPPADESTSSAISQARLANQAEIRVLLADDPAENHLDGSAVDSQDIRLANVGDYASGVPVSGVGNMYFAEGTTDTSKINETNWQTVPGVDSGIVCSGCTAGGAPKITSTTWDLLDGYLRVEYRDSTTGDWVGVTKEWLQRGFARGYNPPASSAIAPNAILIFQQLADRNGNGSEDYGSAAYTETNTQGWSGCTNSGNPYSAPAGATSCDTATYTTSGCWSGKKKWALVCYIPHAATAGELATDSGTSSKYTGSDTRNNWYPINFYDPREGEDRDNLSGPSASSCAVNGVLNAVELDVGNLKSWLADSTGSGPNVESSKDNGYILYFSDRRGMEANSSGVKTGDSGLEDTINLSSGTAGTPDGTLESSNDVKSPEDVNLNGKLDNYGAKNLGLGFGLNATINANSSKPNPYIRISNCMNTGRPNWVSGARHVLRLVDGTLGKVPTQPGGTGGFTVASENPVYILGDYNANSGQKSTWNNDETTAPTGEAASSIIADSVTLLSNNWVSGGDINSFIKPFGNSSCSTSSSCSSARPTAATTYFRVAIASGKNRTFSSPSWSQSGILYGFGTDGGLHNFLRFVEDWSSSSLYYKGSLVSLFYSTYATGTFKCCGDAVYHPPDRHYTFDTLFSNPANLPPGTPMFRDVDNLSYRQDLTPR